jgi:hypothetical protein
VITVAILINGNPIVAVNAINQGVTNSQGQTLYLATHGQEILHKREDGAVKLAKMLLDTIKNDANPKQRSE